MTLDPRVLASPIIAVSYRSGMWTNVMKVRAFEWQKRYPRAAQTLIHVGIPSAGPSLDDPNFWSR